MTEHDMRPLKVFIFVGVFMFLSGYANAKISLVDYNRIYHGMAFNMSLDAFEEVCRARIRAKFRERMVSTTDAAERDRLTREMNKATKDIDKWVVRFTKDNKTWDASVLAGEFIKGRGEVMLSRPLKNIRRYFFFHDNKLVKIIEIKTKPMSSFMFKFSSMYGKPTKVEYQGNQTTRPSGIIWEDDKLRFSIRRIGEPFNCVMLRWALKDEDNAWTALRARTMKKKKNIDTMVQDAQSTARDKSVDKKMEELLGPDDSGQKDDKVTPLQPLLP